MQSNYFKVSGRHYYQQWENCQFILQNILVLFLKENRYFIDTVAIVVWKKTTTAFQKWNYLTEQQKCIGTEIYGIFWLGQTVIKAI